MSSSIDFISAVKPCNINFHSKLSLSPAGGEEQEAEFIFTVLNVLLSTFTFLVEQQRLGVLVKITTTGQRWGGGSKKNDPLTLGGPKYNKILILGVPE